MVKKIENPMMIGKCEGKKKKKKKKKKCFNKGTINGKY